MLRSVRRYFVSNKVRLWNDNVKVGGETAASEMMAVMEWIDGRGVGNLAGV